MTDSTDSDSKPTPDKLLHTGAEHPVDPEDLVMASGRDVTEERLAKAKKDMEEHGAAAVEKVLP
ncbi:hypothetical protein ACIQF6_25345 [Kitasatospora sp. NPDC092948]|uniref:hypothetical protein n=1 Tax=Kitasatospora sp. NPDC092948 TaxID=3364088 RepID=UPI00381A664B